MWDTFISWKVLMFYITTINAFQVISEAISIANYLAKDWGAVYQHESTQQ